MGEVNVAKVADRFVERDEDVFGRLSKLSLEQLRDLKKVITGNAIFNQQLGEVLGSMGSTASQQEEEGVQDLYTFHTTLEAASKRGTEDLPIINGLIAQKEAEHQQ